MPPEWLTTISIISLALAGLSALIIAVDEIKHPQKMGIMSVVWPVTALYFGVIGLWAYFKFGRESSQQEDHHHGSNNHSSPPDDPIAQAEKSAGKPFWQIVAVGVTHCGGGCTLGDIIGEWTIFGTGWLIAGAMIWPEFIVDFALAYLLGVVFQYFAIAPMRHLSLKDGIWAAIKADTLSLTAFEIGLFAWMALGYWLFFPAPHMQPTQPVYWLMMQVGMIVGFFTSYPMNWWLIKKGLKEPM